MFKQIGYYYTLTKPGIVRGNVIHTLAGALMASVLGVNWSIILGVLIGTALVVASACVVNNYLDRQLDAKMKRTAKRPSVTGKVPLALGGAYAMLLGVAGFWVLAVYTNWLVVAIGSAAYVLYVAAYGWAKRHTIYSTLIGAIPGALPAMAGFVAVTGELTVGAWLMFLLIAAWQMPHFYAISVFRRDEYKAAGLPVLGAMKPFEVVRQRMLVYMLMYALVITGLIMTSTVGAPSGLLLLFGAAYWLYVFRATAKDESAWARSVFGASLLLTLLLVVAAGLNVFLPPM